MVAVALAAGPGTPDEPVAFFLIGDTHILANKKEPDKLDDRSASLGRADQHAEQARRNRNPENGGGRAGPRPAAA